MCDLCKILDDGTIPENAFREAQEADALEDKNTKKVHHNLLEIIQKFLMQTAREERDLELFIPDSSHKGRRALYRLMLIQHESDKKLLKDYLGILKEEWPDDIRAVEEIAPGIFRSLGLD